MLHKALSYFYCLALALEVLWNQINFSPKTKLSCIATNGQLVSLFWCQTTIWDQQSIFLLFPIDYLRHMLVSYYGAPSLTREDIFNLHQLLGLTSSISQVQVPWDSRPCFTVTILWLHKLGETFSPTPAAYLSNLGQLEKRAPEHAPLKSNLLSPLLNEC